MAVHHHHPIPLLHQDEVTNNRIAFEFSICSRVYFLTTLICFLPHLKANPSIPYCLGPHLHYLNSANQSNRIPWGKHRPRHRLSRLACSHRLSHPLRGCSQGLRRRQSDQGLALKDLPSRNSISLRIYLNLKESFYADEIDCSGKQFRRDPYRQQLVLDHSS